MSADGFPINDAVQLSTRSQVGVITLNRPGRMNAINDDIRIGVPNALERLDNDPAVNVILVNAAGEKAFCVGADIKEFREQETAIECRRRMAKHAWFESFDNIKKPIVAAIHGYCFGGGMEIALACDLRMAAPNAVFSLPEVNLGLIPGGGGTQRLPRIIGLSKALDLMLTGERIDATEAKALNIVTRLSGSNDALAEESEALARELAEKSPTALAYLKESVRRGMEMPLKDGLGLERDLFSLLMDSADRREAANAFREKRKPDFSNP
jgi:enoyl-CoA hydratase